MILKLSKIKFSDFQSPDDFFNYLLMNNIKIIKDEHGKEFSYLNYEEIWQENKPEQLQKFKI